MNITPPSIVEENKRKHDVLYTKYISTLTIYFAAAAAERKFE